MKNILFVLIITSLMVTVRPSVADDWPQDFMQKKVDECVSLNEREGKTKLYKQCQCIMERTQKIIPQEKFQEKYAQELKNDKTLNEKIGAIVVDCHAKSSE